MKKIFQITSIVLLSFAYSTNAQCPDGNISFNSQAQVNQFAIDYPNCTQISGFLKFQANSGTTDITDLSPMSNIQTVAGNLELNNNQNLQNLDGLNNITSVGGALLIVNNGIQNLNGLNNLATVELRMAIGYNSNLTDISAIQNTSFNLSGQLALFIDNNPQLAVCNLPNICAYLANDPATHPRNIHSNLAECVNEQAVIDACNAQPGCTETSTTLPQWPTSTYVPVCDQSIQVIADNCYTGEYSMVQLVAGESYEFSSSVPTDFITITNHDATVIYAYGFGSVDGTADENEVIRFYLHLDDQCNWGDNVDRERRIMCVSNMSTTDINKDSFSFYPNPVMDELNIVSNKNVTNVSAFNIAGQEVLKNAKVNNGKVNLASLSAGVYVFRVTLEGGQIETFKIVKK